MTAELLKDFPCKLSNMEYFLLKNITLNECCSEESTKLVGDKFLRLVNEIAEFPESIGCPLPCRQINYKMSLDYFHNNSWSGVYDTSKDIHTYYALQYRYTTMFIEERVENLEYDVGSFLAAAGGNLGLMLGLSCLTVMFSIIEYCKNFVLLKQFLSNKLK